MSGQCDANRVENREAAFLECRLVVLIRCSLLLPLAVRLNLVCLFGRRSIECAGGDCSPHPHTLAQPIERLALGQRQVRPTRPTFRSPVHSRFPAHSNLRASARQGGMQSRNHRDLFTARLSRCEAAIGHQRADTATLPLFPAHSKAEQRKADPGKCKY